MTRLSPPFRRIITHDLAPFAFAGIFLSAVLGYILIQGMRLTNGIFIYALDDAYIHLAMGKQLALHGVWGIRPDEFTPSSSSLLWTVLMAAGWRISSGSVLIPLICNCLAALGLLYLINRVLLDYSVGWVGRLLLLAGLIVIIPLPTLIISGMEHVMQLALVLWFCHQGCAEALNPTTAPRSYRLILLAMLNTAIRFEGLFIIAVIAGMFLLARRGRLASAIVIGGLLPVVIAGLISLANGWYFLPASIIAKTSLQRGGGAALLPNLANIDYAYRVAPLFLLIALANIVAFVLLRLIHQRPLRRQSSVFHLVAIGITLIHTGYASFGWFHRYEAYLLMLNVLTLVLGLWEVRGPAPRRVSQGLQLSGIAVIGFVFWRSLFYIPEVPAAMHDIYRQPYQMARFLQTAYPDVPVVLNDIGAVSFFTTSPILDLVGLASLEPLQLRREDRFSADTIAALAAQKQMRVGLIYEKLFPNTIPPAWIKIGSWTIQNKTVTLFDTVSFYVFDPANVAEARSHFQAFSSRLPADIIVQESP
ncbi:MAG: hypothetical protein H0T53_02335 [Herpetosiphonaceae bacterium]|nr:hypothetical protein [Herpetosiphonaceae bacterium]